MTSTYGPTTTRLGTAVALWSLHGTLPECTSVPWGTNQVVEWDAQENISILAGVKCLSDIKLPDPPQYGSANTVHTYGTFACTESYVSISIPNRPDAITTQIICCPKNFSYKTGSICTSAVSRGEVLTLYQEPTDYFTKLITTTVSESLIEVEGTAIIAYEFAGTTESKKTPLATDTSDSSLTVAHPGAKAIIGTPAPKGTTISTSSPSSQLSYLSTITNIFEEYIIEVIVGICALLATLFIILRYHGREERAKDDVIQPPEKSGDDDEDGNEGGECGGCGEEGKEEEEEEEEEDKGKEEEEEEEEEDKFKAGKERKHKEQKEKEDRRQREQEEEDERREIAQIEEEEKGARKRQEKYEKRQAEREERYERRQARERVAEEEEEEEREQAGYEREERRYRKAQELDEEIIAREEVDTAYWTYRESIDDPVARSLAAQEEDDRVWREQEAKLEQWRIEEEEAAERWRWWLEGGE